MTLVSEVANTMHLYLIQILSRYLWKLKPESTELYWYVFEWSDGVIWVSLTHFIGLYGIRNA
jgi:hypothetical protein